MKDEHWVVTTAIVNDLRRRKTDVSELRKVIAYLRWAIGRGEVDLFEYLRVLAVAGDQRSESTVGHYLSIEKACRDHLRPLGAEVTIVIQILGWAARQI